LRSVAGDVIDSAHLYDPVVLAGCGKGVSGVGKARFEQLAKLGINNLQAVIKGRI
jgi:hypothetical protein